LINTLAKVIQEKNTAFYSKKAWCDYLNTTEKSINRKLKVGRDLIEVLSSLDSKDVPRGSLRVNISLAYGYIDTALGRQLAIYDWYEKRTSYLNECFE
jgi:hypothetical protein